MLLLDDNTILVHNGHDSDNEKLQDMWKFDLKSNTWSEVDQKGQIPGGRSGHGLVEYKGYLIMYGGILEVAKETEDMFVFHLDSNTWIKIDVR